MSIRVPPELDLGLVRVGGVLNVYGEPKPGVNGNLTVTGAGNALMALDHSNVNGQGPLLQTSGSPAGPTTIAP